MSRLSVHRDPPDRTVSPVPTHGAVDDAALIERIRAGDKAAEARLYHLHVQSVNAVAVRLLGRGAEAEDVVQDAFISALSRLGQLRDGTLFRAWLLRITVHEVHRR